MNALDVAKSMDILPEKADEYLRSCDEVVESEQYVATLKGNTVHIAVRVNGLGGRKLLRDCRGTLARWFDKHRVLFAGVKWGNDKAVRLAEALGFQKYGETLTHVWLMQTKEQFHA